MSFGTRFIITFVVRLLIIAVGLYSANRFGNLGLVFGSALLVLMTPPVQR